MKLYFFTAMLLFCANSSIANNSEINSLSELRWQNRIIVIVVNNDKRRDEVENELVAIGDELRERDIIWFLLTHYESTKPNITPNIKTNYKKNTSKVFHKALLQRFSHTKNKIVLIGKDGGIKAQSEYIDIERLFSLIDSMPMRQYEMQKIQESHNKGSNPNDQTYDGQTLEVLTAN